MIRRTSLGSLTNQRSNDITVMTWDTLILSAEKALISEKKDYMDSSNFDEEINYTLMENVEVEVITPEKVHDIVYNFDTNNMLELKSFLKDLHMSFKIRP